MWDAIALRTTGDERYEDLLIKENYPYRLVRVFSNNVRLNIPEIEQKREIPLVPWKSAFEQQQRNWEATP
jgi:hypothetical protein